MKRKIVQKPKSRDLGVLAKIRKKGEYRRQTNENLKRKGYREREGKKKSNLARRVDEKFKMSLKRLSRKKKNPRQF